MKSKAIWQRPEFWLVSICLLLALAVRIFRIAPLMVFTYDQGRDFYVLQKISRGDITLIGPTTGLPGVFLGPFMYYFLLPGFIVSNGSPVGVVVWQMLLIVLSLPFLYLILRPLVGKWWSGIALLWISLTPGAIDQARIIWNPSLVGMLTLPSLFCLFQSKRYPHLLPISIFLFGLSLQTELAYTFFLAPLYAIWLLMYLEIPAWLKSLLPKYIRPVKEIYNWKMILMAIIAFGLTLLPQIVFELKNDFLISRSILTEMGDASKQVSYQQVWSERPTVIWNKLVSLMSSEAPGGQVVAALAFIAAIYVILAYRKKPEAWLFSGYLLLPLVGFMFHRGNYGYFFDYYMSPHYLPVIAVIILAAAHLTRKSPRASLITGGLISLIFIGYYLNYARMIYNIPLFQYTAAKEIEALVYARDIAKTDDPAIEVFVPNLVPVAYQYLSEWLSRTGQATPIDFGADNHAEYILIYEPSIGDGSGVAFKQWYAGWKEGATCDEPVTFGITTVERCERPLAQSETDE